MRRRIGLGTWIKVILIVGLFTIFPLAYYIFNAIEGDLLEKSVVVVYMMFFIIVAAVFLSDLLVKAYIKSSHTYQMIYMSHRVNSVFSSISFFVINGISFFTMIYFEQYMVVAIATLTLGSLLTSRLPHYHEMIIYDKKIYYFFESFNISDIEKIEKNMWGIKITMKIGFSLQLYGFSNKVLVELNSIIESN